MTMKVCTKCNAEKTLDGFRRDTNRVDGRQSWCKVCTRLHQQSIYAKKYGAKSRERNSTRGKEQRARFLEYKSQLRCTFCPEHESVCLDFHHLDPTQKDFPLSNVSTRSWNTIMEEVAKCVVVCKNCHTKVHAGLIVV